MSCFSPLKKCHLLDCGPTYTMAIYLRAALRVRYLQHIVNRIITEVLGAAETGHTHVAVTLQPPPNPSSMPSPEDLTIVLRGVFPDSTIWVDAPNSAVHLDWSAPIPTPNPNPNGNYH